MPTYRYQGEARDVVELIEGEVEAPDFWTAIRAVEARIGNSRPWTLTVWEAGEGEGRGARVDG